MNFSTLLTRDHDRPSSTWQSNQVQLTRIMQRGLADVA
jgi:hypothetical protein